MSLFPAYDSREKPKNTGDRNILESRGTREGDGWLTNSSFDKAIIPSELINQILSDLSDNESVKTLPSSKDEDEDSPSLDSDSSCEALGASKKKPKKKQKFRMDGWSELIKPRTRTNLYQHDVKNVYFEDTKRNTRNNYIDALPAKARPEYTFKRTSLGFVPFQLQPKKEPLVRYYSANLETVEKLQRPDGVISRGPTISNNDDESLIIDGLPTLEEEQKSKTREFNEKIAESPHDIDLWLRYVKFQETSHGFDKSRENSYAICQKKLSIVERGLEKNSDSRELLREKLYLMSELYPADQFSNQIEALVNKDTGNILLWQSFIMATQNSVAMCTVPKILTMYARCFGTMRLWSRPSSRKHDEKLLEMLYQCLIFLRQTGLWEQLWETLRLNLSLNLGLSKDALRFQSSIDEKTLIELEEVILTSRLPLNQLWLRVESLRENCHFISVDRDQLKLIGDSHRFVSPEDVTDFVHPMLSRESNMRLAIYVLVTLKVPLLPTNHCMLKNLGLDKCNWTIDSIESLLPMLYPAVGELAGYRQRKFLLRGLLEAGLTSGPQYLRFHPAQEPYLDFIRDTFRAIAESLPSTQRTSLYVWWLRFERMLVYLCKDEPKSENRRKKLNRILKEFLKKAENRNNLHFYREYALIEREMGRYDSCVNILETAIGSATISNEEDEASIMSLRRALVETLLDVRSFNEDRRSHVKRVLCDIVPGNSGKNDIALAESYLRDFVDNFSIDSISGNDESMESYFLPNFTCDNVACYAYLLYVENRDVEEILSVYDYCKRTTKTMDYLQEKFYVNEIVILQTMNDRFPGFYNILVKRLNIALGAYPDNFYLLSVLAGIESELPNWKLNTRAKTERLWQALSFCLAGRARINALIERRITFAVIGATNKLIYFHRRLSRSSETQHCPLAWRLLMLLLREQNLSQEKGEEVYHESVGECPWTRSIYIDAAEVAPQLLTQIQDVLREKDLRMHVTPEELDILRG